ncbi:MAG: hypothetical protein SGPRY_010776 [Prymnesium sp.]
MSKGAHGSIDFPHKRQLATHSAAHASPQERQIAGNAHHGGRHASSKTHLTSKCLSSGHTGAAGIRSDDNFAEGHHLNMCKSPLRRGQSARPTLKAFLLISMIPQASALVLPPAAIRTSPRSTAAFNRLAASAPHISGAVGTCTRAPTVEMVASISAPSAVQVFSSRDITSRLNHGEGVPTIVFFQAKYCSMCRGVHPRVERLAAKRGARFLYIYHDKSTAAAFAEYDITEVPTAIVFDGSGTEVSRGLVSTNDMPSLDKLLASLRGGQRSSELVQRRWDI